MTQAVKAVTSTILLALLVLCSVSPVLAQTDWGTVQTVDEYSGYSVGPQVAMDGSSAVAVWIQHDSWTSGTYQIDANYSTDGGATWEGAQTISALALSYCEAPQVAMSGSNVVAVWYEDVGSNRISANHSTDGGATWGTAAVISDSFSVLSSPHVAVSGDIVIATWAANDATDWLIYCNWSEDGGATWEGAQLIASGAGTTYGSTDEYPRVVVDGTDAVVAWVTNQRQAPHRKDVHSVNTTDGGETWGTSQVISDGAESYAPKLAMSGSIVVALWIDYAGNITVNINRSTDGGDTWEGVTTLDNGALGDKGGPQLSMSGSGVVAVWYQLNMGAGVYRIWSNRSDDGGDSWNGPQVVDSSNSWNAEEPYVALSGTNAVAVWKQFDGTAIRAYSSYSSDGGITWSTPALIQSDVEVNGFFVRVAASGRHAVAVWCQQESVADVYSNHLTMLETPPTFLGEWGTQGSEDGQLWLPQGVAIDPSGDRVYVSDTMNHRIQVFTATGDYMSQWGTWNSGVDQFHQPIHLIADSADTVYVCDGDNDRVVRFDADGNYDLEWNSAASGSDTFDWTIGIATDTQGDVYVSDLHHNRVLKFTAGGDYVGEWGAFAAPYGIAIDADDNVYVAELSGNRVVKYDGADWAEFASEAEFNGPADVAFDAGGNLYVCEMGGNRIQVFDSDGNLITRWGSNGSGPGQFSGPSALAVHPNGDIYVADTDNHRIQVFSYNAAAHTIALEVGWNMVSMPLHMVGGAPDLVFGDAIVAMYEWNADELTYGEPESIQYGKGYWVRSDTGNDVTVYGIEATVDDWQCEVFTGWNMIGAPSEAILVSQLWNATAEELLTHNGVYEWSPGDQEYTLLTDSDELTPGHSYWLASTTGCTVTKAPPI